MLQEQPCRQVAGEPPRRWIFDDYFDLIVWDGSGGNPMGFQLCYDKPGHECALTWTRDGGFSHAAIDSGESSPNANRTPVLVAGGTFPRGAVLSQFLRRSAEMDPQIRDLVLQKIDEYSSGI
jgi:hypothetical protein